MERKCHNLTHPQKRILLTQKIYDQSPLYNIGGCMQINGEIKVEPFQEAVNLCIQNNDALRIRICSENGEYSQIFEDYRTEEIPQFDFSCQNEPQRSLHSWVEEIFRTPFKIEEGPLYYFAIYKVSDEEYGMLLKIHHIIADGWSINIIQKQIIDYYNKIVSQGKLDKEGIYSYKEYIEKEKEYLQSGRFKKNKEFWINKFKNFPEQYKQATSIHLEGKRKEFTITPEITYDIRKFIEEKKCSLNTFFTALYLIYDYKMSKSKDLVIGLPVLNRSGKKEKDTVGMFTSTMPFRYQIDPEETIEKMIRQVNLDIKRFFVNQKYPYDLLVNDLELNKKGLDGLFQVSINYYNTNYFKSMNSNRVEVKEHYNGHQNYSLQIIINESSIENGLTLSFDYKKGDYDDARIITMYTYFINIIEQIAKNDNMLLKDIMLLGEQELHYKICDFNSTKTDYPSDKTIYELFEMQVKSTPYAIAVTQEESKYNYIELNNRANQIAAFIKGKGLGRENIVTIIAVHSFELIAGILGVLKSGAAYLPIDPNYPTERVNFMLKDSNSKLILTNILLDNEIVFDGEIVDLQDPKIKEQSTDNIRKESNECDLAYLIYTSGSTGEPKGVLVEHKGLVNYVWWAKKQYINHERNTFALFTSISFDLTVTSIFTPLISGNSIRVYQDKGETFILNKIIKENRVNIVKLTPSHLTLLLESDLKNTAINRLIVGGEELKCSLAKEIHDKYNGDVQIFNEYGPTETVVGCMIYEFDPKRYKGSSVPIGQPIDNAQIYILDNNLDIQPNGVEGEIYISGDGIAKGYINRKGITNDRFLKNPFINNKRMYRTGDLAKYLDDGNIQYIGRKDNQINLKGHRIEISEIENCLLEHEKVKNVTILYKEHDFKKKSLIAYVVVNQNIDETEMRNWVLQFLPRYMIPSRFICMDKFPMTMNGKIDIDQLPLPERQKVKFVKYRNKTEEVLITVLEEVLGNSEISMNDNYYLLGGDSIKAIQISTKLNNKGLNLKVKDILEKETIEEIAASIIVETFHSTVKQELCNGNIKDTPIIKWFLSNSFAEMHHYNQSVLLKCNALINAEYINRAFTKIVEHHDVLRINYSPKNNTLFYNNQHLEKETQVHEFDLTIYDEYEKQSKIHEYGSQLKSSFNIESDLLIKAGLFQLDKKEQVILITAHHLVIDGVSWRILLEDFSMVIQQLINGEKVKLPLKSVSYQEWAKILAKYSDKLGNSEKNYWEEILKKDKGYYADFVSEEADEKDHKLCRVSQELDKSITENLIGKVYSTYGMELNEVLISALALSINEVYKCSELVIENERHGRESLLDNVNISRTIGWFTSIYPISLMVSKESLEYNLKGLKEQLRSIPNNGFHYSIYKYLKEGFQNNRDKLILFNFLGDFDHSFKEGMFELMQTTSRDDISSKNELPALIDIRAMIVNRKLLIEMLYYKRNIKHEKVMNLMEVFIEKLYEILELCIKRSDREYTPSDFGIDLSQEDLDSLFK